MAMDPSAPADTTMMRIVHDALRRDLGLARSTLAHDPVPDDRQQAAIGAQARPHSQPRQRSALMTSAKAWECWRRLG